MNRIYLMKTEKLEAPDVFEKALERVSDTRRSKALSYKFMKDKALSLAAGLLIDEGLRQLGLSEKSVTFRYGENEKPYIAGRDDIFFNVSHSGRRAVCVFSDSETGVDIEQLGEASDELIESVCLPPEKAFLAALPQNERNDCFFRLWTAKESYMKLLGTGLSLCPKEIELSLGERIRLVSGEAFFTEYPVDGYKLTVCGKSGELAGEVNEIMI